MRRARTPNAPADFSRSTRVPLSFARGSCREKGISPRDVMMGHFMARRIRRLTARAILARGESDRDSPPFSFQTSFQPPTSPRLIFFTLLFIASPRRRIAICLFPRACIYKRVCARVPRFLRAIPHSFSSLSLPLSLVAVVRRLREEEDELRVIDRCTPPKVHPRL